MAKTNVNDSTLGYMLHPYQRDPNIGDGVMVTDPTLAAAIDHSCGVPINLRTEEEYQNASFCTWYSGCYYCWHDNGDGTGYWEKMMCIPM